MKSYFEFAPPPHLAHVVECFWVIARDSRDLAASFDRIFPDGAADIVLAGGELTAHGPASSFRLMPLQTSVGARVRRGAAKAVLGVSPIELAAGPVLIQALWGRSVDAHDKRAAEASTQAAQLISLGAFVTERVATKVYLDRSVLATIHVLDHSAAPAVRGLAARVALSERHLRRRFRDHVGLGIKQYARIVRFQRLLDAVRHHKRGVGPPSPNWAGMAFDHGFADQAHLIREVGAFAGLTPAELFQAV
jgi:AraC-like DNA-binding protein